MDPIEASKIITDEYAAKILVATYKKPMTAIELSRDLNIPIAACYRRLKELESMKLVACIERRLTRKGKRISVYQSLLKNAYIFFENGKIRVRFEFSSGATENFGGDWKVLDILEK